MTSAVLFLAMTATGFHGGYASAQAPGKIMPTPVAPSKCPPVPSKCAPIAGPACHGPLMAPSKCAPIAAPQSYSAPVAPSKCLPAPCKGMPYASAPSKIAPAPQSWAPAYAPSKSSPQW